MSQKSFLKLQAGRPPGNKDVTFDERGNVIAVMKLDTKRFPTHRVCCDLTFNNQKYCILYGMVRFHIGASRLSDSRSRGRGSCTEIRSNENRKIEKFGPSVLKT